MIGDYLDQYTYEYLLRLALSYIPNTVDKREGSIIYDALAPACMAMALQYMDMKKILIETYASTSNGEYLDRRVGEQGVVRHTASYAVKRGDITTTAGNPMQVPLGSRFSIISDTESLVYAIIDYYRDEEGAIVAGAYQMQCEAIGTVGNGYVGRLLPIAYLNNLGTAVLTDIIIPGQDVETDDDLRQRYFISVNQKPFGGNIAQYDQEIKEIDGVGEVQVYPAWNGGGTVKLSVIDAEWNAITQDFINYIQLAVDPENTTGAHGDGLGIAPIGHWVTVTTPDEISIDIDATITLSSGYTISQVEQPINAAISDYLLQLRKEWGIADDLNRYFLSVYAARINSAILNVPGVANVQNTTINTVAGDLTLTQDATTQQLPQIGTVTLHEST